MFVTSLEFVHFFLKFKGHIVPFTPVHWLSLTTQQNIKQLKLTPPRPTTTVKIPSHINASLVGLHNKHCECFYCVLFYFAVLLLLVKQRIRMVPRSSKAMTECVWGRGWREQGRVNVPFILKDLSGRCVSLQPRCWNVQNGWLLGNFLRSTQSCPTTAPPPAV